MPPQNHLTFRPVQPEDVEAGVALIHLSMGAFGTALFGLDDPSLERRVLAGLFRRGGNRFSHEWGELALLAGQPAGLLLALPGDAMARLNLGLFCQAWGPMGVWNGMRFVSRSLRMASMQEAQPGELLVANLAVFPQAQGRGIGRRLLARAEESALRRGLHRMALVVDFDNPGARRLYASLGYVSDRRHPTPALCELLHTAGVERMVKYLE